MTRTCHRHGPSFRLLLLAALCTVVIVTAPVLTRAQDTRRELETLDKTFQESVLRGWKYFNTSFADDGVACVHCHRDHSDLVSWAGSYPKIQIFDQTPYRVKTLRMVILEAMVRHTDLGPIECGEMAEDLQAYIAWWGDGQPLVPGLSADGIPPEEDLAALDQAVNRGRLLFHREKPTSCSWCHTAEGPDDSYRKPLKDVSLGFPRAGSAGERAVAIDSFLLSHYKRQGVIMNARSITDITAYLAELSRGKIMRPGALQAAAERIP